MERASHLLAQLYGVIFGLSDAILGLTILAWGNSIGDLVPDVSIARAGFPRQVCELNEQPAL